LDERDIVHSAISHINNAKTEIENLPKNNLSQSCQTELDLAYQSLNESITHCLGVFGPASIKPNRNAKSGGSSY
jgi:hypothetical protein